MTAASAGEAESAESIVVDYSVTRQEGLKRRQKSTIQFLLFTHNTGFLYTQVREGNPEGGHRGGQGIGALHTRVILCTAPNATHKRLSSHRAPRNGETCTQEQKVTPVKHEEEFRTKRTKAY